MEKFKMVISAVDKFSKPFKKIAGSVATIAKGIGKSILGITAVVTALAAAFISLGKKAFDALDDIGKTADRTGIAAEKLQAFQLGAVESGASVEDLNKAMEKFAKNIGDVVVKGTGEATYALDNMGIQLRNNEGFLKDNDTLLTEVVAGIGKLGSESEKAATLMSLFGKPGIKLNQVLGNGAEAMEAWIRKADEMGIIIDAKAIKAVEAFNDRFAELKFMLNGLVNQTFAALAPTLATLITQFKDFTVEGGKAKKGIKGLADTIATNLVVGAADGIDEINSKYEKSLKGIDRYTTKTSELAKLLRDAFDKPNAIEVLNESATKLGENTGLTSFMNGFDLVFVGTIDKFKDLEKLGMKVSKTLETGLTNAFMNIGKGGDALRDTMDTILKQIVAELIRVFVIQAAITGIKAMFAPTAAIPGIDGAAALGGSVMGGESYLVGEKGMEVFTPKTNGEITPNNALGGSTNVSVNYNITAFDAQSATQAIAQQAPTIVGIIEQSFRKRGRAI